jgi:hypothetical protein
MLMKTSLADMYDKRTSFRYWSIVGVSVFFGTLIVGYGYFEAREYLSGPQLIIDTPQNGATLTEAFTTIEGRATNISKLTLNDKQIFVNEEGAFREYIVLPEGYTTITANARDRFGRTVTSSIALVYTANKATTATSTENSPTHSSTTPPTSRTINTTTD